MPAVHTQDEDSEQLDVVIVGAGMSGLLMGIRLKRAGISRFRIFEKASSIGGTWRENRYPGLSCDVPSFFYSYSFEPKLDWTHRFSPGPEIRAYFESVADKYDIRRFISFENPVESARYEDGGWSIQTGRGEQLRAKVLIAATGPLHHKNYPAIAGLDSFAGALFHSADWDEDVEMDGARIGVIGNGSTGVQMMRPLS
ncbi:MAG: NAD(P)/FAD-dependent oxidoreductase, partial [Deltaproteobacteria bacterium]|nr:NAD(P)/FAD-dependent oxidoreductase [Deltaproteobacteria bacterium]